MHGSSRDSASDSGGHVAPIVFISHFSIRPGKLESLKALAQEVVMRLDAEKPRTLVYLDYVDEVDMRMTFVHLFADAAAMDLHFEGAQERTRAALEFIDPSGWEIYGRPSDAALGTIRALASSAGVPLTVRPEHVAGFVRLSV